MISRPIRIRAESELREKLGITGSDLDIREMYSPKDRNSLLDLRTPAGKVALGLVCLEMAGIGYLAGIVY